MSFAAAAFAAAILIVATAGSVAAQTPSPAAVDVSAQAATIQNQGGTLEGHTPTAFAGMGTGLFAGDNLNPSFPEGVGVQTYLTFDLPAELAPGEARIVSNALTVSGNPFEDLGALIVEPVLYDAFGPALFDLVAIGPPSTCEVTGETAIECDATEAVEAAISDGRTTIQVRIRFEEPADNDGTPDLALFFRTDSNTNEPGLFELVVVPGP